MGLTIPGDDGKSIFPHNRDYNEGVSERGIRAGAATVVVALDGSGDAESVQEGINMLPTEGGVVYIKEGTYIISKKIDINKNNISLIGAALSTKIKTTAAISMIEINNENCIIKDISIEGNNSAGGNICIQINNDVINTIIENCIIEKAGNVGILIGYDSSNTKIGNCTIRNNLASAIGTNILSGHPINRVFITNNYIHNNGQDGVKFSESNNWNVIGNIIKDNTLSGIRLNSLCDNCIISNNIAVTNSSRGIWIQNANCDKNIIIGNIALGNITAQIQDGGTNTHPNGASGTNNLALDDLNIIA